MALLYFRCIPSILTDNDGCGAAWSERRALRPNRNPAEWLATTCPSCGREVAMAANVGRSLNGGRQLLDQKNNESPTAARPGTS